MNPFTYHRRKYRDTPLHKHVLAVQISWITAIAFMLLLGVWVIASILLAEPDLAAEENVPEVHTASAPKLQHVTAEHSTVSSLPIKK